MKALYNLKDLVMSEIEKVNQKGDMSPGELECMYYAVDVLKDIDELTGESGYSERRSYNSYGDNSYRRGRNRDTGRYVSRDSYESMMSRLENMRSNATDPHTRRMVDRWMDEMENS